MIRTLNFFCVALMGLTILALYHVSERTRVADMQLGKVNRAIAEERTRTSVLQTEWERLAGPARIQMLAMRELGMSDTASIQLSSFDQLPRRGDGEAAPLGGTPLRAASAQLPAPPHVPLPRIQQAADRSGL